MNKPTVIYIRRPSQQPSEADCTSLPRRGAPIGALAFNYVLELDSEDQVADSYLEFSFSLANSKHDVFNRKLSREIVLKRMEKKRDYADKHEPSYHRFDVPAQSSELLRPYDALRMIVRGHYDKEYILPARLVSSIEQMLTDNDLRNQRLQYVQTEGAVVARVRDLLSNGSTAEEILSQLGRVRVGRTIESLKETSSEDTVGIAAAVASAQ